MDTEKLLEVVASLRSDIPPAGAGEEPHAGQLTFGRADQLAKDPGSMTPQEREHLDGCARCASLLDTFKRHLPPNPVWRGLKAAARPLAAVALAVVAPLTNWAVSSRLTNSTDSPLDWWGNAQQRFLHLDVVALAVVALLVPVFHWLGWVRKTRLSVPLTLLGFLAVSVAVWGFAQRQQAEISRDLHAIFLDHRWIAYEPPGYNPYPDKKRMPDRDELARDLKRLRDYQFDGLITFSASGNLGQVVPRLARQLGFKAVIMGIYVGHDKEGRPVKPVEQLRAALEAREWVDAYCLGHNTPTRLDLATLAEWMAELRQATGRPVTTTAPLVCYLGDRGRDLRALGDFLFPDVHAAWHGGSTPAEALRQTREALVRVTELPRDRPVLLKMICYPARGGPGLTEENQARFFTGVCRDLYLPSGVYLSIFSAYDLRWKNHADHPDEWDPGEEWLGIFTADGRPRQAAEVLRKGFPIQSRP